MTVREVPFAAVPARTSEWLPVVALAGIVTVAESAPVDAVVTVARRTGSLWNVIVVLVLGAQPVHPTVTLCPGAGVVSEAVHVGVEGDDGVGDAVADDVGEADAVLVGHAVGVGEAVGEAVGEPVGVAVGVPVGVAVGVGVGDGVGHGVGEAVGEPLGEPLGDPLGDSEGEPVGDPLGEAVAPPSSFRIVPSPVGSEKVGRSD